MKSFCRAILMIIAPQKWGPRIRVGIFGGRIELQREEGDLAAKIAQSVVLYSDKAVMVGNPAGEIDRNTARSPIRSRRLC